jgi:DNA-binding transcriptional ArsR family regulator
MAHTKKESSACQPSPLCETPSSLGIALSDRERSETHPASQGNTPEHPYYAYERKYGQPEKLLRASRGSFSALTTELAGIARDLGLWNELQVWVAIEQHGKATNARGQVFALPLSHEKLSEHTGLSVSTVKRYLKKLIEAELIEVEASRQQRYRGNTGYGANLYYLNYYRATPAQRRDNPTEIPLEHLEAQLGTFTLEAEVITGSAQVTPLSSTSLDPKSTGEELLEQLKNEPLNSSALNRSQWVKGEPLIITNQTYLQTYLPASQKMNSEKGKKGKLSENQLAALEAHLSKLCSQRVALDHYKRATLRDLSAAEADELIKATKDPESELARKLRNEAEAYRRIQKAEAEKADDEAKLETQREQREVFLAHLAATYGLPLSEAEETARATIQRQARRNPARALELETLEASNLSPAEKRSKFLELIMQLAQS